jgi:hypothetical protein
MHVYILDAGGAALVLIFLVVFMLIAFLVEALGMILFKYNPAGKAISDSLIINLVSLAAGFLLLQINSSLSFTNNELLDFLLVFLLTVLLEAITLYLLNRNKPFPKTLLVTVIINILTYLVLYLFKNL